MLTQTAHGCWGVERVAPEAEEVVQLLQKCNAQRCHSQMEKERCELKLNFDGFSLTVRMKAAG